MQKCGEGRIGDRPGQPHPAIDDDRRRAHDARAHGRVQMRDDVEFAEAELVAVRGHQPSQARPDAAAGVAVGRVVEIDLHERDLTLDLEFTPGCRLALP